MQEVRQKLEAINQAWRQENFTAMDQGHDMFVFHRVRNEWLAVFRLILF